MHTDEKTMCKEREMQIVEIEDVKIGEGLPKICATITQTDIDSILAQVKQSEDSA